MKLNNIRLLVNDFDNCFKFYSEKVGLTVTWGKLGGDYASFDIGIDTNCYRQFKLIQNRQFKLIQ